MALNPDNPLDGTDWEGIANDLRRHVHRLGAMTPAAPTRR
jgi:hypothetical protein